MGERASPSGRSQAAKRWAWFVALYLASAGAFALAVHALRALVPG